MFLLIPRRESTRLQIQQPLHSNMFLLIPALTASSSSFFSSFTFQYVSINTESCCLECYSQISFTFQYVSINTKLLSVSDVSDIALHSNMFLLIPITAFIDYCNQESLHSNMFLLIPYVARYILKKHNFTFQYVSINT